MKNPITVRANEQLIYKISIKQTEDKVFCGQLNLGDQQSL